MYSVELYGTQFLYLKDLTEVDPTGILPLLVTVLMVVQQRLMPMGNMDPMQQKMMRIMPIGFGFYVHISSRPGPVLQCKQHPYDSSTMVHLPEKG